jgi:hypothetical protein
MAEGIHLMFLAIKYFEQGQAIRGGSLVTDDKTRQASEKRPARDEGFEQYEMETCKEREEEYTNTATASRHLRARDNDQGNGERPGNDVAVQLQTTPGA